MIKHKQQQVSQPSGESGFTIIESLVAMLVVTILLAAIAPTIVIATATRVQSKRVEQATQAARTFIDGVKTGAVTAPTTTIEPNGTLAGNLFTTTNMPVPGQASTPLTSLYCVRKDGNNNLVIIDPDCTSNTDKIFYIQAVKIVLTGSNPIDSTGLPKDGYRLGIRVYRADIDLTKTVKASDASIAGQSKTTQNTFTGTLGDRQSPLVEMTTEIGSRNTSFNALCQRLVITSNTTSNNTCN